MVAASFSWQWLGLWFDAKDQRELWRQKALERLEDEKQRWYRIDDDFRPTPIPEFEDRMPAVCWTWLTSGGNILRAIGRRRR